MNEDQRSEQDLNQDNKPETTNTNPQPETRIDNGYVQQSPTLKTDAPQAAPTPKSKKSKKMLLMGVVLLLFLTAGVAAFMVLQNNKPNDNTTQNNQNILSDIEHLRVGSTQGPAGEIFPAGSLSGVNASANVQLYEGLVGGKDGSFVPLLAESWTNPDQSTWTFKLKPNVQFHTGKVVTADDVKQSIEAQASLDFWDSFVSTIESSEVTGDLEITIKTATPDPLLLNRLSKVFIRDLSADSGSGLDGTGAFMIDPESDNNESVISLKAFPEYHQGISKTKKVTYVVYDSVDTAGEALAKNEIDMLEQTVDSSDTAKFNADEFNQVEFLSPGAYGLYLNLVKEDSPLNDLKVREAIAYAIDRQALLDSLDEPEFIATNQTIPKSLAGFSNELTLRETSKEKVTELLTEAGYPDGIELSFLYFEGVQSEPPIIIEQLKAAGFTINEIVAKTGDEMFAAVEAKEFDLYGSTYTSDIEDARDVFGSISVKENPIFAAVDDVEFDKLLQASDTEFDPIARTKSLQAINKYIYDNLLWIPIRNTRSVTYYPSDVQLDVRSLTDLNSVRYWGTGRITK